MLCRVTQGGWVVQKYDCQEPGSAPEPTLGNRVWTTFTFYRIATRPRVTCAKKLLTIGHAVPDMHARGQKNKHARWLIGTLRSPVGIGAITTTTTI